MTLLHVRLAGSPPGNVEYAVMSSRLEGSFGLVPARYSCRFVMPSPSGSPPPVGDRLPKLLYSQASGSPSPSVSAPGYNVSVCTTPKALLRLIHPQFAL